MKKLSIPIFIMLLLDPLSSSCEKDKNNTAIDSREKAKEVVEEINYLTRKHFPSSFISWQLSDEIFSGGVKGKLIIDGSYVHSFNEGWGTYTSCDIYKDVYVEFDNYQDHDKYPLAVNGIFNLNGSISEKGKIGGNSSKNGKHILTGIFSVSGKYKGSKLKIRVEYSSETSIDYVAILTVGDRKWKIY